MKTNIEYNILIVDDILDNLQVLGNVLTAKGYQIAYSSTGEDALLMLEEIDFDLILLDIMMPGMDGYEVCEKIRENYKTKDIPIIFLTAKTSHESIAKGFELGAQDYITKPFNYKELLARVHTHLIIKNQKDILEEEVYRKTQKLSEVNKRLAKLENTKGNFLNLISYEFWKLLNNICDVTNLLEETNLSDKQQNCVEKLNSSTEKLNEFVKTLLLIAFTDTKEYELNTSKIGINNLLEEIFNSVKGEAEVREVKFSILSLDIDRQIFGDNELIKRCFLSIVDNALKFSYKNDEIELKALVIDKMLSIEIKDSGDGFPKEILNFFDELIKTGDYSTDKDKYGLGLITAKIIVDTLFGSIEIGNLEGKGAFVKIMLPIA